MSLNRAIHKPHGYYTKRVLPRHQEWSVSWMLSYHAFCFLNFFWDPWALIPGIISSPQLSTCPLKVDNWPYSLSTRPHLLYSVIHKGQFPMLGSFPGRSSNEKVQIHFLTMIFRKPKPKGIVLCHGSSIYCNFVIKLPDSLVLYLQVTSTHTSYFLLIQNRL